MAQIFIDGRFVDAATATVREVANPATAKPVGHCAECGVVDAEQATVAARAARVDWSACSSDARRAALKAAAAALRRGREGIETLLIAEGGLTGREARTALEASANALEQPVRRAMGLNGGVRAILGPASSPLLPIMRDVASALLAGETVVLKPAPGAALAQLEAARAWAGLPPGVVNVLSGDAALGQALVAHAGIDAVSFTGSAGVGAALAVGGRPLQLHTGGADAAIVARDADLDLAVRAVAWSRLRHGGRSCASSRRLYVHSAVADEFVTRLHQYVGLLEVDNPVKPAVVLGPLASADAAKRCEGRVVKSMREGARLVLGGFRFRPSGLAGYWLQPTILTDVRQGALAMREEMAGPILTVTPYTDEDVLQRWVAEAADPLGVSVFGADEDALCSLVAALHVHTIWVNLPQSDDVPPAQPGAAVRVYRPAYARNSTPDFYELDPLQVGSLVE